MMDLQHTAFYFYTLNNEKLFDESLLNMTSENKSQLKSAIETKFLVKAKEVKVTPRQNKKDFLYNHYLKEINKVKGDVAASAEEIIDVAH